MARLLTSLAVVALLAAIGFGAPLGLPDYQLRLLIVICINIVLVCSMGLANGFTGVFSLGQVGFVATGAYVSGILLRDGLQWHPNDFWPFRRRQTRAPHRSEEHKSPLQRR